MEKSHRCSRWDCDSGLRDFLSTSTTPAVLMKFSAARDSWQLHKEALDDSKNESRLQSVIREGEESRRAVQIEIRRRKAAAPSGIFQTQQGMTVLFDGFL
jgi:hypothetical protein